MYPSNFFMHSILSAKRQESDIVCGLRRLESVERLLNGSALYNVDSVCELRNELHNYTLPLSIKMLKRPGQTGTLTLPCTSRSGWRSDECFGEEK